MFSKPRPVPSPGALKVLYQLAYISSGTAVGVAALCAEERRRRLQIVQRIADNAKAIRQHPRHIQNAALAVNDGFDEGFFGRPFIPGEGTERRRRRGRNSQEVDDPNNAPFKAPELPSVVDTEYARTFASDHKGRRRRIVGTTGEPLATYTTEPTSSGHLATAFSSPLDNYTPFAQSSETRIGHLEGNRTVDSSRHRKERSPALYKSAEPSSRHTKPGEQRSPPAFAPHATNSLIPGYIPQPTRTSGTNTDATETEDAETTPEMLKTSAEDISHSVDLFFEFGPPLGNPGSRQQAHRLLMSTLEKGSLEDIRSLCLWMLDNETFATHDGQRLVSACHVLKSRFDSAEVLDLYADVFATQGYRRLDPGETLSQRLKILINASRWNFDMRPKEIGNALFVNVPRSLSIHDAVRMVTAECNALLLTGEVALAADVLLVVPKRWGQKQDSDPRTHFIPLAEEVIHAALDSGHLSPCQKLLRWSGRFSQKSESLHQHFNRFVEACRDKHMYGLLVDLLRKGRLEVSVADLMAMANDVSKATLAVAASTDEQLTLTFQSIYREVPRQYRLYVNESSALMALNTKWKSTRNLEAIEAQIPLLTNWLKEHGDEKSLRKLDEAILEIYISANKLDRALASIARIHGTHEAGSTTCSLAALLFAKKGAWNRLNRLLEIAGSFSSFYFDAQTTKVFNEVIFLYSRQHSAVETRKFVTGVMDRLGFSPNVATTRILLECFVSKSSLDLIPQWLDFLTVLGLKFELTAEVAAGLLKEYYLENRPSHVIMFRICRALTSAVPSFNPQEFVDLIKRATSCDLRQFFGINARLLAPYAQLRIERLEAVKGYIPDPGVRWSGKLLFSDEDKMLQLTQQASTPAQDESTDAASHPPPVLEDPEQRYHRMIAEFNGSEAETGDEDLSTMGGEELEAGASFQNLRQVYQRGHLGEQGPRHITDRTRQQQLERDMVFAMSLGHHQHILDLYHKSCDAIGLPASVLTLEIAVESSLRLHGGNRSHAEELMAAARDAGMNVTCAMGPLLIHQMKSLDMKSREQVDNLRMTVIEYYRMNDENGWPVSHHVGVTAAHMLIINHRPSYGLNILSAIYQSEWAARRPLDIVAMTVFLKGYKVCQSLVGIRWVVRKVLTQDIRITKKFLVELRETYRGTKRPLLRRKRALLMEWVRLCRERQMKQMYESKMLGQELVECIAKVKAETKLPETSENSRLNPSQAALEAMTERTLELPSQAVKAVSAPPTATSPKAVEQLATSPSISSHSRTHHRRLRAIKKKPHGDMPRAVSKASGDSENPRLLTRARLHRTRVSADLVHPHQTGIDSSAPQEKESFRPQRQDRDTEAPGQPHSDSTGDAQIEPTLYKPFSESVSDGASGKAALEPKGQFTSYEPSPASVQKVTEVPRLLSGGAELGKKQTGSYEPLSWGSRRVITSAA